MLELEVCRLLKLHQTFAVTDIPDLIYKQNGPRREKTCLLGLANNTGADQPGHPCSLISAFVIRFLESIYLDLLLYLVSVAEQAGLNLTMPETPKTGLLTTRPK